MSSFDSENNEPQQSTSSINSSMSDEYKATYTSLLLQYVTSPQKWRDFIKFLLLLLTLVLTVFSVIAGFMGLSKIDQVDTLTKILYSLTTTPPQ